MCLGETPVGGDNITGTLTSFVKKRGEGGTLLREIWEGECEFRVWKGGGQQVGEELWRAGGSGRYKGKLQTYLWV